MYVNFTCLLTFIENRFLSNSISAHRRNSSVFFNSLDQLTKFVTTTVECDQMSSRARKIEKGITRMKGSDEMQRQIIYYTVDEWLYILMI